MTLQEKAEKIKTEAEKVIAAAYKGNPGYGQFIKCLSQKKNIGSQSSPFWVEVETPYMTVDGRIKMLVDDVSAAPFTISPVRFESGADGTVLARVTITTAKAVASGTAKVGIGGSGVDSRNPYENGETSCIGRALGFLGYGLLGGGIASYEEVKNAIEEKEKEIKTEVPKAETPKKTEPKAQETKVNDVARPVQASQLNAIKNMAKKLNVVIPNDLLTSLDFKTAAALIASLSKGDITGFSPAEEPAPVKEVDLGLEAA